MSLVLGAAEYRALVENSPVMIWRSGTDALCDYFNDTWLAFTGRTMEQEMGNGWAEGVHPDDLQPCVDLYLDRFHKRQSFEMEYRLRRHDGVYRYIFDRGTPFYGDDGAFKGFIGSCVDVDDRRRAQADRDRQHEQKMESARQFERWVVEIVSHDIRDPLGVVDFAAHILLKQAGDPEAVKRAAGRARRGVERIKHIVGDLLDFSRARHGGVPIAPGRVDLHRICTEVLDEFREAAGARPLRIESDGGPMGCVWDEHRIVQALSNLVSNAVQHSAGTSPITVRVFARENPVVLEVHNEGHIPEEIRPFLFNPFAAGGKSRGRSGGLGLGLFIAKAIAEAHGGGVEVRSSPDEGTRFRLVLPREPVSARSVA
jgi:two-component system CheB/CheR fusion protein